MATSLDSEYIHRRLRSKIGELLTLLETYQTWADPLSQNIHKWALQAFQNISQIGASLDALHQRILIDALYGRPLSPAEVPYLIDGENTLPEPLFDQLLLLATVRNASRSPFNNKLMISRQVIHRFALSFLALQPEAPKIHSRRRSSMEIDWAWIKDLIHRQMPRTPEEEEAFTRQTEAAKARQKLQLIHMRQQFSDPTSAFSHALHAFATRYFDYLTKQRAFEQSLSSLLPAITSLRSDPAAPPSTQLTLLYRRATRLHQKATQRQANLAILDRCLIS